MTVPAREADQATIHSKKQEFVRRQLWSAAVDLFFELGFDQTTVEQIARRVNVSSRTFFRYFTSKEEVMAVTTRDYGAALIEALGDQPETVTPFEAAKAVVKQVTQLAVESPVSRKVLHISKRSPAARSAQLLELPFIEDALAEAFSIRGGSQAATRFLFPLLANITLSTTTMCIKTWLETGDESIDELVDQSFSTLVDLCRRT